MQTHAGLNPFARGSVKRGTKTLDGADNKAAYVSVANIEAWRRDRHLDER